MHLNNTFEKREFCGRSVKLVAKKYYIKTEKMEILFT